MAVREIRLFGDPVLRQVAQPVTTFDKELRTLVKDLTDTMLDAPGSGLAAPQLGVLLRVFVYDVDGVLGHLVNPRLGPFSEEMMDGEEGCLSLPGLSFELQRPERVLAAGQNQYGDPVVVEGSGWMSRALQHETDHLDGVLFIDRLDARTQEGGDEGDPRGGVGRPAGPDGQGQPAPAVRTGPVAPACDSSSPAPRRRRCRACGPCCRSRHDVVAVITRPDTVAGRGRRPTRLPGQGGRRRSRPGGAPAAPGARPRLPGPAARDRPRLLPGRRVRRADPPRRPGRPAAAAG